MINAHVHPTTEEHSTNGYDCWCDPVFLVPCDECEQPDDSPTDSVVIGVSKSRTISVMNRASCWKCQHGYVELTREEVESIDAAVIVVHRA